MDLLRSSDGNSPQSPGALTRRDFPHGGCRGVGNGTGAKKQSARTRRIGRWSKHKGECRARRAGAVRLTRRAGEFPREAALWFYQNFKVHAGTPALPSLGISAPPIGYRTNPRDIIRSPRVSVVKRTERMRRFVRIIERLFARLK